MSSATCELSHGSAARVYGFVLRGGAVKCFASPAGDYLSVNLREVRR